MKKILFSLLILGLFVVRAESVGVADTDEIRLGALLVYDDAVALVRYSEKLVDARDRAFTYEVFGSTQGGTLTVAQRIGLFVKYQSLKAQLIQDLSTLP